MSFNSKHIEYKKMALAHWDVYYDLVKQDHVMLRVHGRGLTLREAKAKFKKSLAENESHPILGNYSLYFQEKYAGIGKMYGSDPSEVEIGYILIPELWGRGIGTEVCARLIQEASTIKEVQKLVATIDPSNGASRRILNKNGFTTYATDIEGYLPAEYLERAISDKNHEIF